MEEEIEEEDIDSNNKSEYQKSDLGSPSKKRNLKFEEKLADRFCKSERAFPARHSISGFSHFSNSMTTRVDLIDNRNHCLEKEITNRNSVILSLINEFTERIA
jgi:hypothetical protein